MAGSSSSTPGLLQSLVVKAQRKLLDDIGNEIDTPIVYLKAAWAEPVLYGGRGERMGQDIDVLVRPKAFHDVAAALQRREFRPWGIRDDDVRARHVVKAWTFGGPRGMLPVDLHETLSNSPWFLLDTDEVIDRSVEYDSVDGPIRSLCPEDQVVYAAAHQANHGFLFHERQIDDLARLIALSALDWATVERRACDAYLRLALALVIGALRDRGAALPSASPAITRLIRLRQWMLQHAALPAARFLPRGATDNPQEPLAKLLYHHLILLPLLSDRSTALPRYALGHAMRRVRRLHARFSAQPTEAKP